MTVRGTISSRSENRVQPTSCPAVMSTYTGSGTPTHPLHTCTHNGFDSVDTLWYQVPSTTSIPLQKPDLTLHVKGELAGAKRYMDLCCLYPLSISLNIYTSTHTP